MNELWYRIVLYLHVLSAIASIGPFFLLFSIVNKLRRALEEELNVYLHTFKLAVSLVKHSGHVLVITGALLVFFGPWTWKTPWIVMTLLIMFASVFFLARAFSPTLREFRVSGHEKGVLAAKLKRTVWSYFILLLAMLWFMVDKPALW